MQKIIDEFSDLPISRQRKWQLRHPEKQKAMQRRWIEERGGREKHNAVQRKWIARQRAQNEE